jgi:hypothetical protein
LLGLRGESVVCWCCQVPLERSSIVKKISTRWF